MKTDTLPRTVRDIYNHPEFVPFGSTSDDWINDPDRMSRCHDAAEDGCDGSTHAETIQDWREFAERLYQDARRSVETDEQEEALAAMEEALNDELDACEARHEEAGTLHEEIG